MYVVARAPQAMSGPQIPVLTTPGTLKLAELLVKEQDSTLDDPTLRLL
jgi:hypothetical protein